MDHQTKNREHKQLVESMETSLKRVMLVAGVAQRLLGKVAIVTGTILAPCCLSPLWNLISQQEQQIELDTGTAPNKERSSNTPMASGMVVMLAAQSICMVVVHVTASSSSYSNSSVIYRPNNLRKLLSPQLIMAHEK